MNCSRLVVKFIHNLFSLFIRINKLLKIIIDIRFFRREMMLKVSVIIPVYNVENYLEECLDSIINQTLKDIEIICINDGSTDNSLEILNDYASKDSRIKVLTQENKGLSATRNHGLKLAEGEYIYFMDSDDILELTALEELYGISKNDEECDIVIFKLINFYDDSNEKFISNYYEMEFLRKFKNKYFSYKDVGIKIFDVAVSIPGKFFKRDLLHDLTFPEGLIFEDNLFFTEAFLKSKKMYFYDKHLYNRRIRDKSITQTPTIKFADSITIINKMIELTKEFDVYDTYKVKLFEKKMSSGFSRFAAVCDEDKEEYFNILKDDFKSFNEEFKNDSTLNLEAGERSKLILNTVIECESFKEFYWLIQHYDSEKQVLKFREKENKIVNKTRELQGLNNEILSTKGWKYTKPLRVAGRVFRWIK